MRHSKSEDFAGLGCSDALPWGRTLGASLLRQAKDKLPTILIVSSGEKRGGTQPPTIARCEARRGRRRIGRQGSQSERIGTANMESPKPTVVSPS